MRLPGVGLRVASFSAGIRAAGMVPTTELRSLQETVLSEVPEPVRESLAVGTNKGASGRIYCIVRLRYANACPVALQTVYLLADNFGLGFLHREAFVNESLLAIYEKRHHTIQSATEEIRARQASQEEI